MASAIDKQVPPGKSITISPCGQCQYTYNKQAGSYYLSSNGCTGSCGCPPFVNGPLARLLRFILQGSSSGSLTLNCTAQALVDGTDDLEESLMIRAVAGLFVQQEEATRRWKLIAVVLGVLAALLATGLTVALMTR